MKKTSRKCKFCGTKNLLTPSQLKKWSGYCNRLCKDSKTKFNNKTWLHKECDREFSLMIRSKGYCEKCGRRDLKMDCAHVIPRGHMNLRFDPMNALCLDHMCHRFWAHSNPLEFTEWFKTTHPARYDYLMFNKNNILKRTVEDYKELLKYLRERNIPKLIIPINQDQIDY